MLLFLDYSLIVVAKYYYVNCSNCLRRSFRRDELSFSDRDQFLGVLNLILIKRFDYNTNLFRLTEINESLFAPYV